MPMKLTGLTGKALKARALIDGLGKAYDQLSEDGAAHLADLKSITQDLANMGDDLASAVRVMGNGSDASSTTSNQDVAPEKTDTAATH